MTNEEAGVMTGYISDEGAQADHVTSQVAQPHPSDQRALLIVIGVAVVLCVLVVGAFFVLPVWIGG